MPWTRAFEDAWPIKHYVLGYLTRCRYQAKQLTVANNTMTRKSAQRRRDLSVTDPYPVLTEPTRRYNLRSVSAKNVGARNAKPRSALRSEVISLLLYTALYRQYLFSQNRSLHAVVRKFLATVTPSLEGFTLAFIEAGIVDDECILALAAMPDREKNTFIRETLRLNPFHMHTLRVALSRRLQAENTVVIL